MIADNLIACVCCNMFSFPPHKSYLQIISRMLVFLGSKFFYWFLETTYCVIIVQIFHAILLDLMNLGSYFRYVLFSLDKEKRKKSGEGVTSASHLQLIITCFSSICMCIQKNSGNFSYKSYFSLCHHAQIEDYSVSEYHRKSKEVTIFQTSSIHRTLIWKYLLKVLQYRPIVLCKLMCSKEEIMKHQLDNLGSSWAIQMEVYKVVSNFQRAGKGNNKKTWQIL